MKKIYYIGYYSDPSGSSKRKTAPAADTKMDYIISSLKKVGYDVEVLSFCVDDDRKSVFEKKSGYEIKKNGTRVVFFTNYTSKFRILRVIGRALSWIKIRKYLCKKCLGNESKVVIYHSLPLLKVIDLFDKKKKRFILEMEEIYADVIGKTKLRKKEIAAAHKANGYIFPTKMLNSEINNKNKPFVIIHGTYQVEMDRKCGIINKNLQTDEDKIIHCVYAGTLDPRKGGAVAAAAAEFLPENYHVHILGFGSEQEIQNMKDRILNITSRAKAKVTYDGLLYGEDYIRFIQSCDIGLSTQNPDAAFNATSFPSKILSYMANGLRVVSIRIPAIEQSAVGDALFYYDRQTPEEIAKAILAVNLTADDDPRKTISVLSDRFEREIRKLLEGEL